MDNKSNEITIFSAISMKKHIEAQIIRLIADYENETGLYVKSISVERTNMLCGDKRDIFTNIEIEVLL